MCFKGYSTKNEDKTAYNKPGWRPVDSTMRNDELLQLCPKPWRYQHAEETDTRPRWGQFSFYDGGGFVADLGYDNHTGFSIVTNLQNNGWLDRQTRVVLAEFSTFNPSVNILSVATYFYEVFYNFTCSCTLYWFFCILEGKFSNFTVIVLDISSLSGIGLRCFKLFFL